MTYPDFLARKAQLVANDGFAPHWMPSFLFDFQAVLVEWAVRRGRAAIFADCGLGKTPMQLVWAENVVRQTNRPVLIATPLAVGAQVLREANKFGIDCVRVADGRVPSSARIVVTNYERLHYFQPADFAGMVCDESSILKNFDGVRRAMITEFLRTLRYRLLCTATAAPNDYTELGTSSEALGVMGHMDMLNRFFRNQNSTSDIKGHWRGHAAPRHYEGKLWRFKRHAVEPFWRWVSSWARAIRRPSDLGFPDGSFILPPLHEIEHVVSATRPPDGMLFTLPANSMREERDERRRTLTQRCDLVATLAATTDQVLVWCHLNAEGDRLAALIPDALQVSGSDDDEIKEERLLAFADGTLRVLITKPKIGAWGLNLQGCAHIATFPSHSYEQYYQGIRRCWRFGQTRPVRVDMITTDGERRVRANLQRKTAAAERMFTALVAYMNTALEVQNTTADRVEELPIWL